MTPPREMIRTNDLPPVMPGSGWRSYRNLMGILISVGILVVLFMYSYGYLYEALFIGFDYSAAHAVIFRLHVPPANGEGLDLDDTILKVGSLSYRDYQTSTYRNLFAGYKNGDVVPILVERQGTSHLVYWEIPGFNWPEFRFRLFSPWWLPYVFWVMGCITLFLVQPTDTRKMLLVALNFLIAVWFSASRLSYTGALLSGPILFIGVWMTWPVSWHLNWLVPQPLRRLPTQAWIALYILALALGIVTALGIIPVQSYFLGAMLTALGSIVIIGWHAISQQPRDRMIYLLLSFIVLAIAPSLALSATRLKGESMVWLEQLALLSLVLLPVAYLYILVYRQHGSMEVRVNQAITGFSYATIVVVLGTFLVSATISLANLNEINTEVLFPLVAAASVLIGFFAARFYHTYARWFQKTLLGIQLAPENLVETYAAKITTSLEWEKLSSILEKEVLPSLLVRQAAFLRIQIVDEEQGILHARPILRMGIAETDMPHRDAILAYLRSANEVLPTTNPKTLAHSSWVRLVMHLTFENKTIGLFIFGRRDPDDQYPMYERATLQALMDQTALAIINIEQSERLRALYQWDIEREETEKKRLALELHDAVLNEMALIPLRAAEGVLTDEFNESYHDAVRHIREIISGLRPSTLNYSLFSALEELVDEAPLQSGVFPSEKTDLQLHIPPTMERYTADVELHIFRIVQQAVANAIRHARATTIIISGHLLPDKIQITVQDNGIGMPDSNYLDLAGLLTRKHFGLAGMHERAAIIGAQLDIVSALEIGATISITWKKDFPE